MAYFLLLLFLRAGGIRNGRGNLSEKQPRKHKKTTAIVLGCVP
jgi:hypothetical protein